MELDMVKKLFGASLMLAGIVLIGAYVDWLAALGVFLMITGNNFERSGSDIK
jgi:hypothetical protein